MAIYHCTVKIIGRGSGRSSVAAAAYRAADRLYTNTIASAAYRSGGELHNESDGITHDYTRKYGVIYSEIILPENAPEIFSIRNVLWNEVERAEKRKDAQTAREIELALPIEFTPQEQKEALREYIKENFVSSGMCADFSIHDKKDGNPHAHIMLTTRNVSESGFEGKNRTWNKKSHLAKWRVQWAIICNEKLQKKGLEIRIDHRTLEAQGIDREPTIHIGRSEERKRMNQEIIERNKIHKPEVIAKYMNELQESFQIVDKHLTECSAIKQEINRLNHLIKDIEKRADEVAKRQSELKEALIERDSMKLKFWQNTEKNKINAKIDNLTNSSKSMRDFFIRTFNIEPENASKEIQKIQEQINIANNRLQSSKIETFTGVRDSIITEYQKHLLKAEIRPDGKEILKQLERPSYALSRVSKENFNKIIKELHPKHVRALIEKRNKEISRNISREMSR